MDLLCGSTLRQEATKSENTEENFFGSLKFGVFGFVSVGGLDEQVNTTT